MALHLAKVINPACLRNQLLWKRIIDGKVTVTLSNTYYGRDLIGKREVVGFGVNGSYVYVDKPDFPMPAIRWKEDDDYLKTLREKEKGDWKKLSMEEKKALYRASFRSTYAEMLAPTGEWKYITGLTLFLMSVALWIYALERKYIYPELPYGCTEEGKLWYQEWCIQHRVNPIDGIASKWDYEKNRWKE